MTNIALIAIRMLALWSLFQGILSIAMQLVVLVTVSDSGASFLSVGLYAALYMGLGVGLWMLAPSIAQKMVPGSSEAPVGQVDMHKLTKAGVMLISLHAIVQHLPDLLLLIPSVADGSAAFRLETFLMLGFAILLMLRAGWIADKFMTGKE